MDCDNDDSSNFQIKIEVEWETKVKTEIATTEVQFYDSSLKMMVSLPDTFIPKKEDFKECMDESKYYNDLEYKYNPVFDEKPQDKPEYLVQPKCQIELLKNNLPGQNSITQHYNNLNPLTIISPALNTKNCEATQIAPKENSKRLLPHGSETLCTAPIHETSSEVRTRPCYISLNHGEVFSSTYLTSVCTHPDSSGNNTAPKSSKHRWKSDDVCPPNTLVKVKQSDDKTIKTTKKDVTKLDQKSPYHIQKGKPMITKVNGSQSHGQNSKTLLIASDINENHGVNSHIVLGLRRSPREYQAAKVNTSRCGKKSTDCVISHKNSVPKSDILSRSFNFHCERRLRVHRRKRKNKYIIALTKAISYSVRQHEIKTIQNKINFSKYQVENQIINRETIKIIERNHYLPVGDEKRDLKFLNNVADTFLNFRLK